MIRIFMKFIKIKIEFNFSVGIQCHCIYTMNNKYLATCVEGYLCVDMRGIELIRKFSLI